MKSYETSRKILGFFEFFTWVAFAGGAFLLLGAIAALFEGEALAGVMIVLPGAAILTLAMIGIVIVQMARAGVDTAEYTGQILKVSRDQLQVSKDANRPLGQTQGFTVPTKEEPKLTPARNRRELKMETKETPPEQRSINYNGKTIRLDNGKYSYNGITFTDLNHAHEYLDKHVLVAKK